MDRWTPVIWRSIVGTRVVLACAPSAEATQQNLQGEWTATKAERDGMAADDVVGHRLTLVRDHFEILTNDGKQHFMGTFRLNPDAKPAAIDFAHSEGPLKGKAWKGIYALDGDMLTICDNAPDLAKARPHAFEAKSGSGYVLITFKRVRP